MNGRKQLLLGLLMTLISAAIVLGSLSLSFLESGVALVGEINGTPYALFPGGPTVVFKLYQTPGTTEVAALPGGSVSIESPLIPAGGLSALA